MWNNHRRLVETVVRLVVWFVLTCIGFHPALAQEGTAPVKRSSAAPKVVRLGGVEFRAKEAGQAGPGPCAWSSDHVWVDEMRRVHLKLAQRNGRWTAAEIRSVKPLGLGTYEWTMSNAAGFGNLDESVVVGCFAYANRDDDGEIDVEFGRFGEPASGPGRFVVQPAKRGDTEEHFRIAGGTQRVLVRFEWRSDEVRFEVRQKASDGSTSPIGTWLYRGAKLPRDPASFHAHCNLWMFKNRPPTDGRDVEIVIEGFQFNPLASGGREVSKPSLTISSPTDRSTTGQRLITVSGTSSGLPKSTRISIVVNTDQDYVQDEEGVVAENGNWTSQYNVLGGSPLPFEHRIFAVARVGGKLIRSDTVRVIKK